MLSLTFTFDIFLSQKINFQQNKIKMYKCFKKIIHAKFHFDHCYNIVHIILINKLKYLCACVVTK